jgi:hypothetical protein
VVGGGSNTGLTVDGVVVATPSANQNALADARGTFNRAFAFGTGSTATAFGGDPANPLSSAGNNTAITLGAGANSYAGRRPVGGGGNTPNNQFAFAGPGKNAVNGVNP